MRGVFVLLSLVITGVAAQCNVTPKYQANIVTAQGWKSKLVTNDLTRPRGIIFDKAGNLLVIDNGIGVVSYKVQENADGSACLTEKKTVVSDRNLNHGIAITDDGKTLFASTPNNVYIYNYDQNNRATSNQRTVITNMQGAGHITRTLFVHDNYLLVSVGSESNLDAKAADKNTGRSTIRSFVISQLPANGQAALSYPTSGKLLGWGLRNSVGVTVDKKNKKIWSVENSVDNLMRGGQQVWQDNPGEELNYHGLVSGTIESDSFSAPNFGYPYCVAIWDLNSLPNNSGLNVGNQIQVEQSPTGNKPKDSDCNDPNQFSAPRLTFQAHMAPLDCQFDYFGDDGGDGDLWVTFHGSWNRNVPIGYKLSKIPFGDNGDPTAPSTEKNNYKDILWNGDVNRCQQMCFRPVGVAIGSGGRVFVTSDATGEIYLVWSDAVRGQRENEERDLSGANILDVGAAKAWYMGVAAALGIWLY